VIPLNLAGEQVMTKQLKGKRIELISTTDPYTELKPGDRGTIILVDDMRTIHVSWDNGSQLGWVPGEDQYKLLEDE
jgi:hypothetical protein